MKCLKFKDIFKKKKSIIFLFLISLIVSSCDKENAPDCFQKNGKEIEIGRTIVPFDTLEIYDIFEVELVQDTVSEIKIFGGENLLPEVITNIQNNKLTIENKNSCGWVRGYDKKIKLIIHNNCFENIHIYGQSTIKSLNILEGYFFEFQFFSPIASCDLKVNGTQSYMLIYGTGDYTIKGTVSVSVIDAKNHSMVFADSLQTNYTNVFHYSTGNCYMWANERIKARVAGSGSIFYKGNPTTIDIWEHSGTGELLPMNN